MRVSGQIKNVKVFAVCEHDEDGCYFADIYRSGGPEELLAYQAVIGHVNTIKNETDALAGIAEYFEQDSDAEFYLYAFNKTLKVHDLNNANVINVSTRRRELDKELQASGVTEYAEYLKEDLEEIVAEGQRCFLNDNLEWELN